MSFLNPKPDNPVKKYLEWKSDDKCFMYYDKETKEKVKVELPLKFIVLDEFSTITGFNPNSETSIYSNEVSNLNKEILNVKAFKTNLLISGLYKDIKDRLTAEGGKFTKSVYAIVYTAESYEIVCFKLHGASISGWIDKKFNTDKFGVVINGFADGKKGAIKYTMPVYEQGTPIDEKTRERLTPIAMDLQAYLESRKLQSTENEIAETTVDDEAQRVIENINKNGNKEAEPVEEETEYPF